MHEWLHRLDQQFPVRYAVWMASAVLALLFGLTYVVVGSGGFAALLCLALVALGWRDTRQRRHSVLRNYPVIGHLRFLLEFIRPEIRQYFIESDNEAAPFSRQQRSLVYQRAKGEGAPKGMWVPSATSGSTIHWRPPRLKAMISASPSVLAAAAARSPTAPACSTSPP